MVVVESPSKAKTIKPYLKGDYSVLASYGHIRDLPSKNGSVQPDEDFSMEWELSKNAFKALKDIELQVKDADILYLATDPDREGEAISWHVYEHLKGKKLLKKTTIKRVVFHEITKKAVQDAIAQPRDLNQELVDAYLARRALDYLFGFTLSPVLWRKLPGAKSAGRVQSVALRLIVEREKEIESFVTQEYWTIEGLFKGKEGQLISKLSHVNGKSIDKFFIPNEDSALDLENRITSKTYTIHSIEKKQIKRQPSPPFMTSTLQQEASRKLGFSASKTMKIAQSLYEGVKLGKESVGLITYMRTDGLTLANEAVAEIRSYLEKNFTSKYIPKNPREYKTKVKNAQEAHEAIRPTSIFRAPDQMSAYLDSDQLKLYDLIWKRTLTCQMENAILDQVIVLINSHDQEFTFKTTGSVIAFDGFLKVYEEGKDDSKDDACEGILPSFQVQSPVTLDKISKNQHFTEPPPRYSEATLVKKLEELGIGRPSTYVSLIQVIQDRGYVKIQKKRFVPSDRGWVVIGFLENYFEKYVAYDFTAQLEDELDKVSNGDKQWKNILKNFWGDFSKMADDTKNLKNSDVIDRLHDCLKTHLFKSENDIICPKCEKNLHLKLSRFGGFIGCEDYPNCTYTRTLDQDNDGDESPKPLLENILIGTDPQTYEEIFLKTGMYGPYLQWDPTPASLSQSCNNVEEEVKKPAKKTKKVKDTEVQPKRLSIPPIFQIDQVNLELALFLKTLPLLLGNDEEGRPIHLGIGKFGPYVKSQNVFVSVPKTMDIKNISLPQAIQMIKDKWSKTKSKK